MKIIAILFLILLAQEMVTPVQAAKTMGSAIIGKLVPALMKCFGKKLTGVDMNKVHHIISKAAHGFDKLSPSEIVYETIKVVASQCPQKKLVDVVLLGGEVVRIVVMVTVEGPKLGTAYVIEKASEALERRC